MQKTAYFPHIDGLRAIAIALVVIFHAGLGWVPGGFVGVDVFFVLSGFLITGQIAQHISNGQFTFSSFYLRRIRRLLPAYIVVALTTFVVACFILLPNDLVYHTKLMGLALLSLSNFYLVNTTDGYFARQTDEIALLHTWSLSVEEQFYLVWPVLLLLVMRFCKGRMLVLAIAVIYMLSAIFSQWYAEYYPSQAYYLLPARFFELLTGAILALTIKKLPVLTAFQSAIVALSGLLPVMYSAFYLQSGMQFPGVNALPVCIGTALLIYSGYSKNIIGDILSSRPFVGLGKISYSLYLWHWPVFVFIRYMFGELNMLHAATGILVSILLSIVTLYFVENTFRFRWKFPFRKTFILLYLLPLIVFIALLIAVRQGEGFPGRFGDKQDVVLALESKPKAYFHECLADNKDCYIAALIGDSHAEHFSPFVNELIGNSKTLKLQTHSIGFCMPLMGIYRALIDEEKGKKIVYREDSPCYQATEKFYNNLTSDKYRYVILSGYWSQVDMKPDGVFYLDKNHEDFSYATSKKVFREAFYKSIAHIIAQDITPVILKDNLSISEANLKCSRQKVFLGSFNETCEIEYNELASQQEVVNELFADMARDFPRLRIIDVNEVLCDAKYCQTTLDGMPLYRDLHHITGDASILLGKKYLAMFGSFLK